MLFGEFSWLVVIIVNLIGQFLQGNILQPYIMGREVDMHPLLVLVSFIFFGALFGITGVILAIPITGIIRTTHRYFKELGHDDESPPSDAG
jgi:putative permease